jgi:3-oxoacyl-[acyl-carrier-protein] synthase III
MSSCVSAVGAASSKESMALKNLTAGILAVASALPDCVMPSDALAARLGVSDEWIVSRTGIRERRIAAPGTQLSELAAEAGRRALARAGVEPGDVDLILVATSSSDTVVPNTAPLVADLLCARTAFAADVGAACTGWVAAMSLAAGQLEGGRARTALVIGAEIMSRILDPDDRLTAPLFGDGAGAVVMQAVPDRRAIGPVVFGSDASGAASIVIRRDENRVRMDGIDTFKHAVRRLSEATLEALTASGRRIEEIDLFVYHQANARILRAVGERLSLPSERVLDVVGRYGNTSAASVPIALADADRAGRLHSGARVLVAAFGAGFVWGAGVLEWNAA